MTNNPIFDNDKGVIDCSTYMHLVLRGIRYEKSPYATNDPAINTQTAYPWAAELGNFSTMGLVREAAELAAYYSAAGRFFLLGSGFQPCTGDLIFFKEKNSSSTRFLQISHVGMIAFDTSKYYNVTNQNDENQQPSVVLISTIDYSNPPPNDRNIVGFARPFYEVPKIPYDFRDYNFLEAPWKLPEGQTKYHGIFSNCNYQAGTIWTGTISGVNVEGDRLLTLADESIELLLPAGHYILTGAPRHLDRRAHLSYHHWGLRVERKDGGNFSFTEYGYTSSSQYVGDCVSVSGSGNAVWDRGFGAKFTLTNARTVMCAKIHISECPVENGVPYQNYNPNNDIWRPRLILDPDYL